MENAVRDVWQCMKDIVLPAYASTKASLSGNGKANGIGSTLRAEEIGLAVKEAIKSIAEIGEASKVNQHYVINYDLNNNAYKCCPCCCCYGRNSQY